LVDPFADCSLCLEAYLVRRIVPGVGLA